MAITDRRRLGEILIEDGLITTDQLSEALKLQSQNPDRKPIGEILVQLGYLSEEGLALTLSKKLGTKYITFSDNSLALQADQNLDKFIDERFASNNSVLPISKSNRYLNIAMWDPLNFVVIDNIKKMTNLEPVVFCTTKKDIEEGIARLYHQKGAALTAEGHTASGASMARDEADKLKIKAAEAPVVKLVSSLVQQAVINHASDIHIEPQEDRLLVRYRIDGILYEQDSPPREMTAAITSRIKILSRLDIAEKRLPQDGGFMSRIENRNIDFRVSTIPTIYGEKITIRLLDKEQMNIDLASLGMSPDIYKAVSANIRKPYGLILVTGPTGSGKSTTLYCVLNAIKSSQKNILTIEDPVEYRIDGANQVQASPQIGLTFAAGLRSFLRQDPDIIMVGEIRDLETAEICVRSALVGRLVLSTLHTNDSIGAISRLVDFGIEPFLLSSTINMVIAQRLVRKLCPECKKPANIDSKTANKYGLNEATIYEPAGCDSCKGRGYAGRAAIFEVMPADDELKSMIEKRTDVSEIRKYMTKSGMKLLRDDGLDKVRQGVTSLGEVLAATLEVA